MAEIKYTIKVKKGHELDLEKPEEIQNKSALMYPAFCKTISAVEQIIKRTHNYHEKQHTSDEQIANDLFSYSGNVIVFDAKWGGGKTRTMLSITEFLSDRSANQKYTYSFLRDGANDIQNAQFYTLPPVAPAIMERGQNILQIVLSRLYSRAQNILKEHSAHFDYRRDQEQTRANLVRAFEDCLRGINGIKNPGSEDALSISSLQELSDGMSLRRHFHDLIQLILELSSDSKDKKNNYLILQLDDADSQIKYGYEVLEDVCKYLMIPNLIIFMSCEMQFMAKVVMQEHMVHFKESVNNSRILIMDDLLRKSQKYLDKMVPPANVIHLPEIDTLIEERGNEIALSYVENINGKETSLIPWSDRDTWNLQNTILMMIYRKTGIVFCKPNGYLHNFIPRTIRGINQLLYTLGSMKDLPQMENCWDSVQSFADCLKQRNKREKKNLEAFEDYFMNAWLPAKINNPRDLQFLNSFYHSARRNGAVLALKYFDEKYCRNFSDKELSDSLKEVQLRHASKFAQICIDDAIKQLEKSYRTQDDFLLYFSIRTIRTLQCHKMVVKAKDERLEKYDTNKSGIILFDYNPIRTGLPSTYLMNASVSQMVLNSSFSDANLPVRVYTELHQNGKEKSSYETMKAYWENIECSTDAKSAIKLFKDTMTADSSEDALRLNVLNLITLDLILGNENIHLLARDTHNTVLMQQKAFATQEYALLIASNWDVQEKVYKYLSVQDEQEETPTLPRLFEKLDEILKGLTDTKLWEAYQANFFNSCSEEARDKKFIFSDNNTFYSHFAQIECIQHRDIFDNIINQLYKTDCDNNCDEGEQSSEVPDAPEHNNVQQAEVLEEGT